MNFSSFTPKKKNSTKRIYFLVTFKNLEKIFISRLKFFRDFFYFSLRSNYLFQLIYLNTIQNLFFQTFFFSILKRLKREASAFFVFFNLPFLVSKIFSPFSNSFMRKTIYLYRFFFLCNLPLVFFAINTTFCVPPQKECFSLILPEKKPNFLSFQEYFYLTQLKRQIKSNHVVKVLIQKLKTFTKQQNLFYSSQIIENCQDFLKDTKRTLPKKRAFSTSKWFVTYIKIKKKYLLDPNTNENSFLKKKINFSEQFQFQRTGNRFLSILQPINLSSLKEDALFSLFKTELSDFNTDFSSDQRKNNLPFPENRRLIFEKELEIKNDRNFFLEGSSKKQWLTILFCQDLYSSFQENKDTLKNFYKILQNENFLVSSFKNFFQTVLVKPLLNQVCFFSPLISNNKFFFVRSYKDAFNLTTSNVIPKNKFFDTTFFLKNQTKRNILNPSTFLYHFDPYISDHSLLTIPKIFSFQNLSKQENYFRLREDENLYDLDFYLNTLNTNEKFKELNSFLFLSNVSSQVRNIDEEKTNVKEAKMNSLEKSNSPFLDPNLKIITEKRVKLKTLFYKQRLDFFNNFKKWIFTSQWWLILIEESSNQFYLVWESLHLKKQFLFQSFFNQFDSKIPKQLISSFQFKRNKIFSLYLIEPFKNLYIEPIYRARTEQSFWTQIQLVFSINNTSWISFAWFLLNSVLYCNWVPILSGISYFYLWLDFEQIRSFSYPSWKTTLKILTRSLKSLSITSKKSRSKELKVAPYLSRSNLFFIYSSGCKVWNTLFFPFNRLNKLKTFDLSIRSKNLVSTSFLSKKALQRNYSFYKTNEERENELIQGNTLFEKWSPTNYRIRPLRQKNQLTAFSLKSMNDVFFSNQNWTSYLTTFSSLNSFSKTFKIIPLIKPFREIQRWLFIGSIESGKCFAIKNIAGSQNYPLIHLSLKDINNIVLALKEVKNKKINKQQRWLNQLSTKSFLFDNVFNLSKILAPSIFWIADLHAFTTNSYLNQSILMTTFLKILSHQIVPEKKNDLIFIGSTEYPTLVDPKFVSRQRLDFIMNFRTPSFHQRHILFTSLLKNKGFFLKGLTLPYEVNCNTLGYTFQDITSLVNETFLIKTTENNNFMDSNTIRLALYRKNFRQSVQSLRVREDNLYYKIGKAIVQLIFVYPKSIIFLSKYYDFWKKKSYFLSTTYLESSIKKTTITEFVLFLQILNCLAGSAARDAGLILNQNFKQTSLVLTSQVNHDLSLASNIIQSLLIEFPLREISFLNYDKKKNRIRLLKDFPGKDLNKITSGFDCSDLEQDPAYINGNNRTNRVSFSWLFFFSGLKKVSKKSMKVPFLETNKDKSIFYSVSEKNSAVDLPYEKVQTRLEQQKIKKNKARLTKMLWNLYMENLGFPWKSDYLMDCNIFQTSLFFRQRRPIWNSQTTQSSYYRLFFDRDLFVNQKMLIDLYTTYGKTFQVEKLTQKRIKNQLLWANSGFIQQNLTNNIEIDKNIVTSKIENFYSYQNLVYINAYLSQPQLQTPRSLHTTWITGDPYDSVSCFDIFSPNFLRKNSDWMSKESSLFEFLLEVYNYLFKFFVQKTKTVEIIKESLIKQEVLHWEDLEIFLKKPFQEQESYKFK